MTAVLTQHQLDLLNAALSRMDDESKNTRGTDARDVDGAPTSPFSPDACSFCFFGHVQFAVWDSLGPVRSAYSLIAMRDQILRAVGDLLELDNWIDIATMNDRLGTAMVRDLVRSRLSEIKVVD